MNVRTYLTSVVLIILMILMYVAYVLSTFRTFGITWDEVDVYTSGRMTWNHLAVPQAPDEPQVVSKTPGSEIRAVYNSAYASVLYRMNRHESYERYHAFNMLFGLVALLSSYVMFVHYYNNPWLALLAPLMLVTAPRYFGDLPANPKDGPFASMYIATLMAIYFSPYVKNTFLKIIILGGVFGVVQNLRVLGVTALGLYASFEGYLYAKLHEYRWKLADSTWAIVNIALVTSLTAIVAMFITTISWPYLGSSFMKHGLDILRTSREYPWFGGTLTNGVLMNSTDLPWHYLPTWFVVTTPLFILVMSMIGVVRAWTTNFRNPLSFLFILSLVGNVSMYYLSDPHVYDGLRHFLFLVPLLGLMSAIACIDALREGKNWVKGVVLVGIMVHVLLVGQAYAKLHPYQYVYFNELVGGLSGASGKYETDYWGASYREAVMWLRERVESSPHTVKVYTCANPFISTYYFSSNMQWVDSSSQADYSICYTRSNEHEYLAGNVIHVVERDGVGLNYITKHERK